MLDWKLFRSIVVGNRPLLPVVAAPDEALSPPGLTMGTLYLGRQGTGKTSSLARHVVEYFKAYPERAIFVLDWSGSITDTILQLILQEPPAIRETLTSRLVYDELGHPERVIPLPEFSAHYGPLYDGYGGERRMYEEQVQRVTNTLARLAPELIQNAPFLAGLGLREIAPQIYRLLTAIHNEQGECWQITEAKRMIVDKSQLAQAVKAVGHRIPEAKFFFEKVYLPLKSQERELRSFALLAMLGCIEPREIRARLGYPRPGWTPREAMVKGLLVLVNGANLINQRNTQHYLFTQAYSLIMAEINRRRPGNPADQPVALVMDEVYSLLSIPGMAEEVGMLAPLYRSRKLELYIVLQSLSQLALTLREQIWSLGNVVTFALENKDDALEIGRQLFAYNPTAMKLPPRNAHHNPVSEPEHGQDRQIADWINSLRFRECLVKRYLSERQRDPHIRYVAKTKNLPSNSSAGNIQELKDRLLRERGILVKDALEIINGRKLETGGAKKPPQL